MDIFTITSNHVTLNNPDVTVPLSGFLWIDATIEEVSADPDGWRNRVAAVTNVHIYDPHLMDATNLAHPSYFDSTQDYAMVVFRKLALQGKPPASAASALAPPTSNVAVPALQETDAQHRSSQAFNKIATQPVTFLILERALITVHAAGSRTIETARQRLLEYRHRTEGNGHGSRLPSSPEDLMLRLINAMVDQYLELRQPLTAQLDRWQRALLDPRRPFKDWTALLDARIELRRLDNLCEEQRDAMQEMRDYLIDNNNDPHGAISRASDLLLVRVNDVMEHIARVLNHARRLESTIESAVQIHFSAMAHRTSEIVRTLTVITALFMPLTLITGIFGMNFDVMPLVKNGTGFWITMGAMAMIVVGLLFVFRRRKYLEERVLSKRR